jgi:hypothetical protein
MEKIYRFLAGQFPYQVLTFPRDPADGGFRSGGVYGSLFACISGCNAL